MIALLNITIDEHTKPADLERVRRNLVDVARELQNRPSPTIIEGIELVDGVDAQIAHKLGRRPKWVRESCVRNATSIGRIDEISSDAEYVTLRAIGYGGPITINLQVI